MYIIAKRKDYYDGVAGTSGIDKTIVYERETLEFEKGDVPLLFERQPGYWGLSRAKTPFHAMHYHRLKKEFNKICDNHSYFIVGFCGKLYVGWKLYRVMNSDEEVSTEYTYDVGYMLKILEEKSWEGNVADSVEYIRNYDAMHMFRDLKSPIFIYDADFGRTHYRRRKNNEFHTKFIINPLLKDYQFYKLFDAVQAFQEVSMFMGGVLGRGEKEIVEVADKYKIAQHGFNKWSFRKEPENKK